MEKEIFEVYIKISYFVFSDRIISLKLITLTFISILENLNCMLYAQFVINLNHYYPNINKFKKLI